MEVGYLPDMFGHIAQMPQLLQQFGFEHAVVWRGVPASVDKSAFWWSAPDGSTVRAEYLVQGYGNGAYLPDDAKALVSAIDDFERRLEGRADRSDPLDERHRPPRAAALARPAGGRGQRPPGRLRPRGHVARRAPRAGECGRPAVMARRAALGSARQPAHGRDVEPRRRPPGRGAGRAGARTGRSARRAVPACRPLAVGAAPRSVAARRAQRRPRLDLRVLDRRSVRRRAAPLRRGGRDRRRARAGARSTRSARPSRATDRSSSIRRPDREPGSSRSSCPGAASVRARRSSTNGRPSASWASSTSRPWPPSSCAS